MSCLTIKPASKKSPKRYYETFYTEQGVQYFIKPLSLKSETKKESFDADFTFKQIDLSTDSVVVNFSIHAPEVIKEIESLVAKNDSYQFEAQKIKLLFNEAGKKDYTSRFSAIIPLQQVNDLFENGNWTVQIKTPSQSYSFYPEKDTKQSIANLKSWIFDLF